MSNFVSSFWPFCGSVSPDKKQGVISSPPKSDSMTSATKPAEDELVKPVLGPLRLSTLQDGLNYRDGQSVTVVDENGSEEGVEVDETFDNMMNKILAAMAEYKEEIAPLKAEISILEKDQKENSKKMVALEEEQGKLKATLGLLQNKDEKHEATLRSLDEKIESYRAKHQELELTVEKNDKAHHADLKKLREDIGMELQGLSASSKLIIEEALSGNPKHANGFDEKLRVAAHMDGAIGDVQQHLPYLSGEKTEPENHENTTVLKDVSDMEEDEKQK